MTPLSPPPLNLTCPPLGHRCSMCGRPHGGARGRVRGRASHEPVDDRQYADQVVFPLGCGPGATLDEWRDWAGPRRHRARRTRRPWTSAGSRGRGAPRSPSEGSRSCSSTHVSTPGRSDQRSPRGVGRRRHAGRSQASSATSRERRSGLWPDAGTTSTGPAADSGSVSWMLVLAVAVAVVAAAGLRRLVALVGTATTTCEPDRRGGHRGPRAPLVPGAIAGSPGSVPRPSQMREHADWSRPRDPARDLAAATKTFSRCLRTVPSAIAPSGARTCAFGRAGGHEAHDVPTAEVVRVAAPRAAPRPGAACSSARWASRTSRSEVPDSTVREDAVRRAARRTASGGRTRPTSAT